MLLDNRMAAAFDVDRIAQINRRFHVMVPLGDFRKIEQHIEPCHELGIELDGLDILGHGGNELTVQPGRSEEHTSELQSLMRISYAVFCLKKKKKTKITH